MEEENEASVTGDTSAVSDTVELSKMEPEPEPVLDDKLCSGDLLVAQSETDNDNDVDTGIISKETECSDEEDLSDQVVNENQEYKETDDLLDNLSSSDNQGKDIEEVEDIPVHVETVEEKEERIRNFFNAEFSRPDLENHGPKQTWVIMKYENYQRPAGQGQEKERRPLSNKEIEMNAENVKIAEYFGEDLNSEDELDQLIQEFAQTNVDKTQSDKSPLNGTDATKANDPALTGVNSDVENKSNVNNGKVGAPVETSVRHPTIIEENESEFALEDDSGTAKHNQNKAKADKKKKNYDISCTKVNIRHLPKNMKKEEFLDALGAVPEYTYLHFTSGVFVSRVCGRKTTGYCNINFAKQEDADTFVNNYRLFILRDEKGDEYLGSTEYAINQRVPKYHGTSYTKGTQSLYDMQNDAKFVEFRNTYELTTGLLGTSVNPDGAITADVMIKEIEERNQQKNELQNTPLLNYVIAQAKLEKERKFTSALKRASEKSRVTIKKERKRDRRDRRERKEKEKEKIKGSKEGESKPEIKEFSKQAFDKKLKQQRASDKSKKGETGNNRPTGKSESFKERERSGGGGGGGGESKFNTAEEKNRSSNNTEANRGKFETEKKDRDRLNSKVAPTSKRPDKKINEKRSSGNFNSSNSAGRSFKQEPLSGGAEQKSSTAADSTKKGDEGEVKSTGAAVQKGTDSVTANTNTTGAPSEDDRSQGGTKKKTVKKIVKVKKVIKSSKSEDSERCLSETKEKDVSTKASEPRESSSKSTNRVVNKSTVPGSNKNVQHSHPSAAPSASAQHHQNDSTSADSKRTKKARPDMQIYRPGSLRSSKLSEPSKGSSASGDTVAKKEIDKDRKSKEVVT